MKKAFKIFYFYLVLLSLGLFPKNISKQLLGNKKLFSYLRLKSISF